mgnify:FL=1
MASEKPGQPITHELVETAERADPVRAGDDRIETIDGRYYIDTPLVLAEDDGDHDTANCGIILGGDGTVILGLRISDEMPDLTISQSADLSPSQAREIAVSLWAAANHVSDGDHHE